MAGSDHLLHIPEELRGNPFFDFAETADLFYFSAKLNLIPAWDKIRPEHVMPAIDYALQVWEQNLKIIRENKAPADFENSIEALEASSDLLDYCLGVFFRMIPSNEAENDQFDEMGVAICRKCMSTYHLLFGDNIIFKRMQDAAKTPAFRKLPQEERSLYKSYYNGFKDAGIQLPPEEKARLGTLYNQIMELEFKCQRNMKKASQKPVIFVEDEKQLEGLSLDMKNNAVRRAAQINKPGHWVFTAGRETYRTFVQSVANRSLREKMRKDHTTLCTAGEHDNREHIQRLVHLTDEAAGLLKYQSTAHWTHIYNLAGTPGRVSRFLTDLRKAAWPVAKRELQVLRDYALNKDDIKKLEPWDVAYYQQKLQKDLLGFNDEDLKPYFEFENTLKGLLRHFEKLLDVRIEETTDYPVEHSDTRSYKVYKNKTDEFLGAFQYDPLARDGKGPGLAWSGTVLSQGLFMGRQNRGLNNIVTKFVRGRDDEPTLLSHYDARILIHELGHCLHDISSKCKYRMYAGLNVKIDMVEFMSQIQELWLFEPEVLDDIACHYKTGEKMPDDLKHKLKQSQTFMAGLRTLDQTKKGWLDLNWWQTDPKTITDVESFERYILKDFRLFPGRDEDEVPSPSFSYSWGGGYDGSFYSYQWAAVKAANAFRLFRNKGLYDKDLSAKYARVLERSNSMDNDQLYRDMAGGPAKMSIFLQQEGLTPETSFDYDMVDWRRAPAQTPKKAYSTLATGPN